MRFVSAFGIFLIPCLFFAMPTIVSAATIYANSSTGNDSNTGTSGAPFATFNKAYTSASAGDTINLTGTFTWTDAGETGDASGSGYTIGKSLTIQGQLASTTIIQAAGSAYTADRGVFTVSGSGVSVTMQNLTVRYGHNTSDSGAAGILLSSPANLTLNQVIVTANASNGRFGVSGVRDSSSGTLAIRNSTIYNNDGFAAYNAGGGSWPGYTGGLQIDGASAVEITNTTFTGNTATYNGGVYQSHSSSVVTITNSTFVNNTGSVTGHNYSLWSGTMYIKNTIIANRPNTSAPDFLKQSGTVHDDGSNIVETQSTTVFTNGTNGDLVGDQASLNIASSLATNSTSNGIPTLALSAGSVAIDVGTTTAHNSISVPSTDARAFTRGASPDIGAYEYNAVNPDSTPPTVSIASPTSGEATTSTMTLAATASDETSMDGVSFYVNGVLQGSKDTSSPYSVQFDTTATSSGSYSAYAVALDSAGNASTSASVSFTINNTPTVSAVSTSTTPTTATITWTSAAAASSRVWFGLTSTYSTSTSEQNTGTRVTTHSVSLAGLNACTRYHYAVTGTNAGLDSATSTDATFDSAGCTGSASISSTNEGSITIASGGTLMHGDLTLTVPASFTATSSAATFQANQLGSAAFFSGAGRPSGYSSIGSSVFHLAALTDATTTLSTFDTALTMTLSYTAGDIAGIDETSLKIYRYDGSAWTVLSSCSVNTSAKTVTCNTSNFSDFALFGTASASDSNGGSASSGGSFPWCFGPLAPGWNSSLPEGGCSEVAGSRGAAVAIAVMPVQPNTSPTTTAQTQISRESGLLFTHTLRVGSVGEDIRALQKFLNAQGFALASHGNGAPGSETNYFGSMTHNALIKFQEAHAAEILAPLGLTHGTGTCGSSTIAFIQIPTRLSQLQ